MGSAPGMKCNIRAADYALRWDALGKLGRRIDSRKSSIDVENKG